MLLMSVSDTEDMRSIIFWIMGSLEEPKWSLILLALFISIAGLVVSYFFSVRLNALALGEEEAKHLGINTESTKRFLFVVASMITGCCVSNQWNDWFRRSGGATLCANAGRAGPSYSDDQFLSFRGCFPGGQRYHRTYHYPAA